MIAVILMDTKSKCQLFQNIQPREISYVKFFFLRAKSCDTNYVDDSFQYSCTDQIIKPER